MFNVRSTFGKTGTRRIASPCRFSVSPVISVNCLAPTWERAFQEKRHFFSCLKILIHITLSWLNSFAVLFCFVFFQLLSKKNCLSYLFILSLVRHVISFSQLPGWFILQPWKRHLRWMSTWYIPNKPRSKRVYTLWPKPHNSYEGNCRRERLHWLSVRLLLFARVVIALPYVYWRFHFIKGRQISSLVLSFFSTKFHV